MSNRMECSHGCSRPIYYTHTTRAQSPANSLDKAIISLTAPKISDELRRSPEMGGKKRRFLSLPVLSVVSLMSFVYYTTVFVFLQDWLGLESSAGFLNALLFTSSALSCLLSLSAAVLADPGRVPSGFVPESEDPQKNICSRNCDKCRAYKPPRSHHCRVCKRCVLKMDHHCVWISNCVGYGNYKPFIIFVLHAAIGSIYSLVIFCCNVTQRDHEIQKTPLKLYYVLCGLVSAGLSLTTGSLLAWHIYLLIQNMTTIEYREGVRAKWLARKSGQNYRHPYDIGVYSNLVSVLGPNMLKWFCPIALGHLQDGTQFPISND